MPLLRRLAFWAFWPAAAVIIWGELTPHPPPVLADVWDKAEHFTAYFGLALLVVLALGFSRRTFWALLGVLALGGALEILQGYTGRDPEWNDMAANSLGWLAGAALGGLILRARLVEPGSSP